jgi:hypothetical protein
VCLVGQSLLKVSEDSDEDCPEIKGIDDRG